MMNVRVVIMVFAHQAYNVFKGMWMISMGMNLVYAPTLINYILILFLKVNIA